MKRSEYYALAQKVANDVMSQNKNVMAEEVTKIVLDSKSASIDSMIDSLIIRCLDYSAEVSGAVTAQLLEVLGVVHPEDD